MTSFRAARPKIAWGAAFANIAYAGYPLDNVTAGSEPRAGSEFKQGASGVEDSWIVGVDYLLTFDWRYIPQTDTASPLATGWDGVGKMREWLEWARAKNPFRWYSDGSLGAYIDNCYLVSPLQGPPASETDGTRMLTSTIRNASTPFDGY